MKYEVLLPYGQPQNEAPWFEITESDRDALARDSYCKANIELDSTAKFCGYTTELELSD